MHTADFEERPWGRYDVLSRLTATTAEGSVEDVVIKKIIVMPGARLSYQSHKGRDEHWFVVSGAGLAIVNEVEKPIKVGDSLDVKCGQKHRVGNVGNTPLIFIEIGTGSVDEDDIIRYEDDFGRVKN